MQWVISGRPWLFDSHLLALKSFDGSSPPSKMKFSSEIFWIHMHDLAMFCMNEEIGRIIGSAFGQVRDCDIDKEGKAWGQSLRVYIEIDLHKPIPRGRFLNLSGNKIWILFTYEKLLKICFKCGSITHGDQGCNWKDYRAVEQYENLGYVQILPIHLYVEKSKNKINSRQTQKKPEGTSQIGQKIRQNIISQSRNTNSKHERGDSSTTLSQSKNTLEGSPLRNRVSPRRERRWFRRHLSKK